jgi:steroid delta-isomerase-like uncharacterized protein
MTTDSQRTAERIPLEVINQSKFDLLDELLSTDFVDHAARQGVAPTREGLKQTLVEFKNAFPDAFYTIDDAIASGDKIVYRMSASGTMNGDFMGIPATGKRASWTEIHVGRYANGRLTEHWGLIDQLGMLVQLGVVPAPGRVPATV